jgi:hypothetical protein
MDDEILAGFAALVGVVHARVHERLLNALAVDRLGRVIGMLLDDREQVAEQPALDRGQLGALDRLVSLRVLDAIDGRARGGDPRRATRATTIGAARAARAARAVLRPAAGYGLPRGFAPLRYLRPSSYRVA